MESRTALIVYGTETGTSQDLAEELGQLLERQHFQTHIVGLDAVNPEVLSSCTLTTFVIATTGQGDFPANAKSFWTSLLRKKLGPDYLQGVRYALVGLGDTSYPKFNWAARKLNKRLRQLGAEEITEACEADEQGEDSTEGAFLAWCKVFNSAVLEKFPLPDGIQPLSEDTPLQRKRALEIIAEDPNIQLPNGQRDVSFTPFPSTDPDVDQRPIPNTVSAILEQNTRVTPVDHWQDVRHLTLRLDKSAPHLPGDALAIWPKNFQQDVDGLLKLMDWADMADKPIRIIEIASPLSQLFGRSQSDIPVTETTLRTLLSEYLDITAIPRRSFFAKIAQYTSDDMHKERLLEFTESQYLDEYYDYATRPRRSILEVLQEFESVKIPWQEAINIIPVMRPRQFSIASGGSLKRNSDGTTRFELLVAIVKYRTVIKKIRQGVCTRYIAALPAGSKLQVSLRSEGRIHTRPQDFIGSHILIGAGTGVAPLRAIIHEKEFVRKKVGTAASTTLIFGCRNSATDYFFEDEWRELTTSTTTSSSSPSSSSSEHVATLQLVTAFSRDQKSKVYVQDRIREQAQPLFRQIHEQNATIVLCGSSGAMPKAVKEALLDVLASGFRAAGTGADDTARMDAEVYLAEMEKAGRFRQETW